MAVFIDATGDFDVGDVLADGTCVGLREYLPQNGRGKTREVHLKWEVLDRPNGYALFIRGGVTGFESFYMHSYLGLFEMDWWACAGTTGRWDSLVIPKAEMIKIRQRLVYLGVWAKALAEPVESV